MNRKGKEGVFVKMPIESFEESKSKSVLKRKRTVCFGFSLILWSILYLSYFVLFEKKNDGNHWILSLIHSLGCVIWLSKKYFTDFRTGRRHEYWYELPNRDLETERVIIFSACYFVLDTIFDAWNASSLFGFILHHLLVLLSYLASYMSGE